MEPYEYSASTAAAEIAAGRLTAETYVSSCLERIAARDKDLLAWAFVDPQLALKQARERDKDKRRGPLHGIPVAFKDIFDTVDFPTEYNSPIYKGHRPAWDASCVALASRAGAIVMGKTATTEFAYRSPAPTRNPHNLSHTPGGSSSGSAAAVAAFMVPIAIGSQTGGSTIRPAAYCGIVGYKPSFGVINRTGIKPVSESLDTVGVLARTVEDVALFTHAVAGIAVPDFRAEAASAPRVGFCRLPCWSEGDSSMHEKLELAASTLARKGAKVSELILGKDFDGMVDDQVAINDYEVARSLVFEYERHRDKLSAPIREIIEKGWVVSRERYDAARASAMRYRASFAQMMKNCDFVLTPAAAGEAPEGLALTGSASFNRLWTMLGVPCLTVPAYKGPRGLPVGVQIVGAYGSDRETLWWAEWARRRLEERS
jgi:amidase